MYLTHVRQEISTEMLSVPSVAWHEITLAMAHLLAKQRRVQSSKGRRREHISMDGLVVVLLDVRHEMQRDFSSFFSS